MADETANKKHTPSFWDSMWGLVLLVAAILLARFFILEPFKIPSGSMEPTLIGHEDYGDRILTNKMAYSPAWHVMVVMAGSVVLIAVGFIASKAWQRKRSVVMTVLLTLGVIGGIGFAWSRDAVASVPRRFDVVVFQYEPQWSGEAGGKINYIKRLVGMPGETVVISGGDLFLRDVQERDHVIRKWQDAPELQEQFWYPVAKAWVKHHHHEITKEDQAKLAFPWNGADDGTAGVKLQADSLVLDGSAPVTLEYKYAATNVHIKQGRWPFRHIDCPATKKPGIPAEGGGSIRNPENAKDEYVQAYVAHPCEGVQCPQCKQVIFPLEITNGGLQPVQMGSPHVGRGNASLPKNVFPDAARFFYGGDLVVNDLKLELDIDVETAGTIQIDVGNSLNRAQWSIPSTSPPPADGVHRIEKEMPALSPGRHNLALAWLDGTVIAMLDGKIVERRPVELAPPGMAAKKWKTVAQIAFHGGLKGALKRLDLFRDQYYSPTSMHDKVTMTQRDDKRRHFDSENHWYVTKIPADMYLMLGDNAPSSSDGRVWGHVPKENLVGRASIIWWPPSRWRTIKHAGESELKEQAP